MAWARRGALLGLVLLAACTGEVSGWAEAPIEDGGVEAGEGDGLCEGVVCGEGLRCDEGFCVPDEGHGHEVGGPMGDAGTDAASGDEDGGEVPEPPAPEPRCDDVDDEMIPRAPVRPTVDGDLSDWPCASRFRLTFDGAGLVDPPDRRPAPGDSSVDFDLSWDESYLYLAAEVRDDALWSDSTQVWEDDSVELYVNGDASGAAEFDDNDHQFTVVRDGRLGDRGTPIDGAALGILVATREGADGFDVELAVPWTLLGGAPAEGRAIALDLAVNDDDDGGPEDAHAVMWLLPPGTDPVHSANVYRPFSLGP